MIFLKSINISALLLSTICYYVRIWVHYVCADSYINNVVHTSVCTYHVFIKYICIHIHSWLAGLLTFGLLYFIVKTDCNWGCWYLTVMFHLLYGMIFADSVLHNRVISCRLNSLHLKCPHLHWLSTTSTEGKLGTSSLSYILCGSTLVWVYTSIS